MGSVELDNANPTILSVSELPTHRQQRKARVDGSKKQDIQELLMAKPSYAMDPFYLSDFSDTESDDSSVEPIDEQEIYGEFRISEIPSVPPNSANWPHLVLPQCLSSYV